jgi:hypothetical protein
VAHELIHTYDFCRASNLDLTNCHHHACTEVRSANPPVRLMTSHALTCSHSCADAQQSAACEMPPALTTTKLATGVM